MQVTLRVGFVGLGAMGLGMARNLHKQQLLSAVWNRTAAKAQALAQETGCTAVAKPADLAPLSDVIVMCVSADADVLEVVDAICAGASAPAPSSSIAPPSAPTRRAPPRTGCASAARNFSTRPSAAASKARATARSPSWSAATRRRSSARMPVLQAMGRTVTHFGASGAGQAAKATNQIMCAGVIQAVAEAMAFAKSEDLPLDRLIETLGKGAGSSWYFVHRAPNILRDSYPAGFRVRLHEKDLKICRAMAARHGVQLPLIEMTLVHYRRLIEQGHGDEDISTLFRLKDALFARRSRSERPNRTSRDS